jgi:glycosyltransferase involved in cell wall biosynthesis
MVAVKTSNNLYLNKNHANAARARSILVVGTESWFGPLLSKHHIVLELCKQNRVLYLEPVYHAGSLLRGQLPQDLYHERYHNEQPNSLTRLKPWWLPKSENWSWMNNLSERIVLTHLRLRNFYPELLISFSPRFAFLKRSLKVPFIYYSVDSYDDEKREAETLEVADLVIAATEVLYNRFKGRTKRLEFLPHGVAPHLFDESSSHVPNELNSVSNPIAGYVGALNSTFNINLLEKLIQTYPSLSVVLVGPYEKNSFGGGLSDESLNRIRSLSNTYLIGPRPSKELGSYIKRFDVCLIPYDISHSRVHFSYHKVLQYLALGKPVITTCFASNNILPPNVAIAENEDSFVNAVGLALKYHDDISSAKSRAFVREHTWESRVRQLSSWIENYLVKD